VEIIGRNLADMQSTVATGDHEAVDRIYNRMVQIMDTAAWVRAADPGEIQERPSNNTGRDHQRNLSFFSTFPSTGCTRRFYNLKFCSPQVNQKIKKSHEVNQSTWSAHANSCYSWALKNTICTTWAQEYSCCTVVDSP
jgi:hypothetical protein